MKKKISIYLVICTVLIILGILTALCTGAKSIPFWQVYESLAGRLEGIDDQIVRNSRLPRAICSLLVGGYLGIAGAAMQGVTRNPLAEPAVMGISQGATLAVALLSLFPAVYGILGNQAAALIGAFFSGGLVLLFSMQNARNSNLARLLLAGSAMGTFFISLASLAALLTNRSQELAFWVAGGFGNITWENTLPVFVIGIIAVILTLGLSHRINIVNLGEDTAIGLGENPDRVRLYTFILLVPICGVSVAAAGNIAFVGLIIPHIVRRLISSDYRYLLPLSFVTGSVLMVWADILAKLASAPYETPIGLFTSLIGIPFFLYLVRKEIIT